MDIDGFKVAGLNEDVLPKLHNAHVKKEIKCSLSLPVRSIAKLLHATLPANGD